MSPSRFPRQTSHDDPTETQAMANVPLVLEWSGAMPTTALAQGAPAILF
jgi:hypothetical protein